MKEPPACASKLFFLGTSGENKEACSGTYVRPTTVAAIDFLERQARSVQIFCERDVSPACGKSTQFLNLARPLIRNRVSYVLENAIARNAIQLHVAARGQEGEALFNLPFEVTACSSEKGPET